MNSKRLAVILILIFAFIMGCSGKYGNFKTLSASDSKVTQQELIDNWTEYKVYTTRQVYAGEASGSPFRATLIVFDPKNDDRKILVGKYWDTVKNQEMWTEVVKANTTSQGNFAAGWEKLPDSSNTKFQEILGADNQLYGIIIRPKNRNTVIAKRVDENTMRLLWQISGGTAR